MKSDFTLLRLGREVNFTDQQIEFLIEHFSQPGHHHTPEQIDNLDAAVEDIIEETEDDEEEEAAERDGFSSSYFDEG